MLVGLESAHSVEEAKVAIGNLCKHSKVVTITVKPLSDEAFELEVWASDKIDEVTGKISGRKGLRAERQLLISAGKQLDDSRTVSDYSLQNGDAVFLVRQQVGDHE